MSQTGYAINFGGLWGAMERGLKDYHNMHWWDWLFCRAAYRDLMGFLKVTYFQAKDLIVQDFAGEFNINGVKAMPRGRKKDADGFKSLHKKVENILIKEQILKPHDQIH
jgi:hypothetical protein